MCVLKEKKSYRGQTFHRFPKEQALRREWINHVKRDPGPYFKINAETKVCSEHFEKQCFVKTARGITELIKDAVVTLFAWTSERPKRRIIIRRPSTDSMEVDENQPDVRRDALSTDVPPPQPYHDYAVPPLTPEGQLEAARKHIIEQDKLIAQLKGTLCEIFICLFPECMLPIH
ncbi:THAP domain-containing protein 2-like isoform X1 [Engraulis encrasicolus]|uniref:THAP domain-containing protein 2-like isoform X1 n=1 Tax=Engraulis encrasicolus TaxID=184585 RepID=UPI002FCFB432